MDKEICSWHRTDWRGQHSVGTFRHPDGKTKMQIAYIGAQVTIDLSQDGAQTIRMTTPINFCPICGERVRLEVVNDENAE